MKEKLSILRIRNTPSQKDYLDPTHQPTLSPHPLKPFSHPTPHTKV